MSRCTDCGFDWLLPGKEVTASAGAGLARYRDLVGPVLAADGGTGRLRARPAEGVWSPLEYLAHLRDVTGFFTDRVTRVLAEDRPVLAVGLRFAELAERRRYRAEDPAVALAQFEQQAGRLQVLLDGLGGEEWERSGVGSGGERTVLDLARRYAHEVHHHLLDVEAQLRPRGDVPGWQA